MFAEVRGFCFFLKQSTLQDNLITPQSKLTAIYNLFIQYLSQNSNVKTQFTAKQTYILETNVKNFLSWGICMLGSV